MTNRSPAGPPCSPAAPLPRSRIRWPSLTPAGIRAWIVRADRPRPLPWQVGHGSSYDELATAAGRAGLVHRERAADRGGHEAGALALRADVRPGAGLAAGAEQSGQGASEVSRSEIVTPSRASVKLIVAVGLDVGALLRAPLVAAGATAAARRRGRRTCRRSRRPPPARSRSRSLRSKPPAPPSRRGSRRPHRVGTGRAQLVVLRALLGVADDVVGLGDRLEASRAWPCRRGWSRGGWRAPACGRPS